MMRQKWRGKLSLLRSTKLHMIGNKSKFSHWCCSSTMQRTEKSIGPLLLVVLNNGMIVTMTITTPELVLVLLRASRQSTKELAEVRPDDGENWRGVATEGPKQDNAKVLECPTVRELSSQRHVSSSINSLRATLSVGRGLRLRCCPPKKVKLWTQSYE